MSLLNRREGPGYGSDTPISMPKVPRNRPIIPMYGFAYNQYGICHDISKAELAELSTPRYAPYDPSSPHNHKGDSDLDAK